jgi:hypothetical protein
VCFRQKQKFDEGLRSRDFDQKMPGLFDISIRQSQAQTLETFLKPEASLQNLGFLRKNMPALYNVVNELSRH